MGRADCDGVGDVKFKLIFPEFIVFLKVTYKIDWNGIRRGRFVFLPLILLSQIVSHFSIRSFSVRFI